MNEFILCLLTGGSEDEIKLVSVDLESGQSLGVTLGSIEGKVTIAGVLKDSPAERSGKIMVSP